MQSRGLPPTPISIFTYLSLSCPSPPHPPPLVFSFFFPPSCFMLWGTRKQQLHIERLVQHTQQAGGLAGTLCWVCSKHFLESGDILKKTVGTGACANTPRQIWAQRNVCAGVCSCSSAAVSGLVEIENN